jgi:Protein of unknown function (DUF2510)
MLAESDERARAMASPAPSGWYPDPARNPGSLRYFDGQVWTSHTAERPAVSTGWNQPAAAGVGSDWARPRRLIWPWVVGVIVIAIFIAAAWLVADIGIAFVDEVRQHPVM